MLYYLDLVGCSIFAISAILVAVKKELDVLGIFVTAFITAVGGGTLRDLLLNTNVFWTDDNTYLYVIIIASLSTYFLVHFKESLLKFLFYADACGMALFCVIGTQKALLLGKSPEISIVMGVLTGVAGGIIRDTLFNDKPIILRREIYVTAGLLCSASFVALDHFQVNPLISVFVSIVPGLALRVYAIKTKTELPLFFR